MPIVSDDITSRGIMTFVNVITPREVMTLEKRRSYVGEIMSLPRHDATYLLKQGTEAHEHSNDHVLKRRNN